MNEPQVLAIVPALNESGNIGKTVQEIFALNLAITVLVIDDGSRDSTAQEAKSVGAKVIRLPINLGIGGAVQTGFLYALKNGFRVAVQIDGDGQHDVRYLEALLKPVREDRADMVIGSRFLPPHLGYQSSFVRRIGIQFFSKLISLIARTTVTDPTSGFRAFNHKLIALFADEYPHDYPEPEAIVVAQVHAGRIQEVPVQMRERKKGISSIRYLMTLYYMIKVTFAILLDMIKYRRRGVWG